MWFFVLDKFLSLQNTFEGSVFKDPRFQKFQSSFVEILSHLLEEIVKNVPLIQFVNVKWNFLNKVKIKILANIENQVKLRRNQFQKSQKHFYDNFFELLLPQEYFVFFKTASFK